MRGGGGVGGGRVRVAVVDFGEEADVAETLGDVLYGDEGEDAWWWG